jgi:hypothetical protein
VTDGPASPAQYAAIAAAREWDRDRTPEAAEALRVASGRWREERRRAAQRSGVMVRAIAERDAAR